MKKILIACAAVLALALTSCNDTNYCYEITTTASAGGFSYSATTRAWCTKNEIKAAEAQAKEAAKKAGASEDAIKVTSKRLSLSKDECK